MSTITKEWLESQISAIKAVGITDSNTLQAFEIALASLEAEAVAWTDADELRDAKNGGNGYLFAIGGEANKFADPRRKVMLYTAPPAPSNAEPVAWLWSHRKHPSEVTLVRPEDDEKAEPGLWSGWSCQALYAEATAPVSVPEPIKRNDADGWWMYKGRRVGGGCAEWYNRALEDCRAAMHQGTEPVSNRDELPDGWVACSERMPNDEEDVLCFGQYGDNDIDEECYQFMGWLSSKGIKGIWRVSDGDSQNRRAKVTHWMPLPAAPQQEVK